jgi:hypothetical protein
MSDFDQNWNVSTILNRLKLSNIKFHENSSSLSRVKIVFVCILLWFIMVFIVSTVLRTTLLGILYIKANVCVCVCVCVSVCMFKINS